MLGFLNIDPIIIKVEYCRLFLILVRGTEYLLPKLNFGGTIENRIPLRQEWAANSVWRDRAISVISKWSKAKTDNASEIFSDDLEISVQAILVAPKNQFFKRKF